MNNNISEETIEAERIAKKLSRAGVCSRREAEKWISEGRVQVNNITIDLSLIHI